MFLDGTKTKRWLSVNPLAGIITTVAGTGISGYSGDGGAATSATLKGPVAIAVDSAGNFYFTDSKNNVIRMVSVSTGIITTVAGTGTVGYSGDGGPATSARLGFPLGVFVDLAGNIYTADALTHRVRKINKSTGFITTLAGTGVEGSHGGYSGDGGPATAAQLNIPVAVTVDSAGFVFIADESNHVIRMVSGSTGIITTVAGNGIQGYSGDGGPATAATMNQPADVALDSAGNIYIVDSNNNVIRMVSGSTGIITTVAGIAGSFGYSGDGGLATSADRKSVV